MGITYDLPPEPSRLLPAFYAALPANLPGYTFIDVRGWLGASLWTTDGVHMVDENFEEQARLLWERVFGPRLECDPVAGQN